MYLGDVVSGSTINFRFTSEYFPGTSSAFIPVTLSGAAVTVYKDATTSNSTTGVTLTTNFNSITGLNFVSIVTTGIFYTTGSNYDVVMVSGLAGGNSLAGKVLERFSIKNRPVDIITINGTSIKQVNGELVTINNNAYNNIYTVGTGQQFTTISGAQVAANSGDLIYVFPGSYNESIGKNGIDYYLNKGTILNYNGNDGFSTSILTIGATGNNNFRILGDGKFICPSTIYPIVNYIGTSNVSVTCSEISTVNTDVFADLGATNGQITIKANKISCSGNHLISIGGNTTLLMDCPFISTKRLISSNNSGIIEIKSDIVNLTANNSIEGTGSKAILEGNFICTNTGSNGITAQSGMTVVLNKGSVIVPSNSHSLSGSGTFILSPNFAYDPSNIIANIIGPNPPVNVTQWGGTNIATPDTAGYPKTTIKFGVGNGEALIQAGKFTLTSAEHTSIKQESPILRMYSTVIDHTSLGNDPTVNLISIHDPFLSQDDHSYDGCIISIYNSSLGEDGGAISTQRKVSLYQYNGGGGIGTFYFDAPLDFIPAVGDSVYISLPSFTSADTTTANLNATILSDLASTNLPNLFIPDPIINPTTGTKAYIIYTNVATSPAPSITSLVNQNNQNLIGRLNAATMTIGSTSYYSLIYTASCSDAEDQLIWTMNYMDPITSFSLNLIKFSNIKNSIVSGLFNSYYIEPGFNFQSATKLMLASAAGKLDGAAGGGTIHIRDVNDTKNRITATVDNSGDRTNVTYDLL